MSHSQSLHSLRLTNGVEVLADVAPHFRSAALAVFLLGGSREESPTTIGLTHLLEHLLFKRTRQKTPQQIAARVDDFGGSINALTDVDSLCLYGQVPGEQLHELFDFFCELLFESVIDKADLELEKNVIKQEIVEASEDPQDVVFTKFSREFWPGNSLGLPVFGLLDTVASFTEESLQARLKELLVGKRIVVCVSGDVAIDEFKQLVEAKFNALPEGHFGEYSKPRAGAGMHLVECPVTQVFLTLGLPWPNTRHAEYQAAQVIATILGAGISSRLFQKIREENGLAYDVGADILAYADTGVLMMNATVEPENVSRCLNLILGELVSLERESVTTAELERAKRMISAQLRMQEDNVVGRLWRLLFNHQTYGKLISCDEELAKYKAVSPELINKVVRDWLTKRELLLVLGGEVEGLEKPGALPALR